MTSKNSKLEAGKPDEERDHAGKAGDSRGTTRRTFVKGVAIASTAILAERSARAAAPSPATGKVGSGQAAAAVNPAAAGSSGAGAGATELALGPNLPMAPNFSGAARVIRGQPNAPGSDFMVDVIKHLDIDYLTSNPAHSFRGLHESLLSYGGNKKPEWLTCLHEEVAVAMGHGYFKITGKPMIAIMHGSVGIQHAAMAIYNAWCDRVPVIVVGGNDLDASKPERGKEIISTHSAQDPCMLIRDYTKWDDTPISLQHFSDSFVRAYKIAMTPPHGPVAIVIDSSYQMEPRGRTPLTIPRYRPTAPPQGDANAVRETARLLVKARFPVIVADRAARSQRGIELLVELCQLLEAPCLDLRGRMNFPNTNHLCRQPEHVAALAAKADVILGIELGNFWQAVNSFTDNNKNGEGEQKSLIKKGTRLLSISSLPLALRPNYQYAQRFQPVDIEMAADGEATLPQLVEEVKIALSSRRKSALAARGRSLRAEGEKIQSAWRAEAKRNWDVSPISTARLTLELLDVVKNEDWSLVGGSRHMVIWARRLWPFERHYHYLGLSGGDGRGYELPSAMGAALANRDAGRISVNLQPDGAFMYTPQALWTAVHHEIPLLTVMMNNRAYHTEVEHMYKVSRWRGRKPNYGPDSGPIGTKIENPIVDYAKIAQAQGMFAIGPISDPKMMRPAFERALQVVKSGKPALVDIVIQPR